MLGGGIDANLAGSNSNGSLHVLNHLATVTIHPLDNNDLARVA